MGVVVVLPFITLFPPSVGMSVRIEKDVATDEPNCEATVMTLLLHCCKWKRARLVCRMPDAHGRLVNRVEWSLLSAAVFVVDVDVDVEMIVIA